MSCSEELARLMTRRAAQIDVKLLLFAIQRTLLFENQIARRFSGCTLDASQSSRSPKKSDATRDFASEEPSSAEDPSELPPDQVHSLIFFLIDTRSFFN